MFSPWRLLRFVTKLYIYILEVVVRKGENSIWPVRWLRLRDGRRSGTAQTENTVRHTKYGRMRGMVVGEGGRSKGFYRTATGGEQWLVGNI